MTREQAIQLARWALRQHYGAETVTEDPAEWVIDALRMAGSSGEVEGAELVLQVLWAKGMLGTLLGLVRELTNLLDATVLDGGEGTGLMVALLRQANQAMRQADELRLNEFLSREPALQQPSLLTRCLQLLQRAVTELGVDDHGLPLEDGENALVDELRAFLKVQGVAELAGVEDQPVTFDLVQHLRRQSEFSARTFGPGARTAAICDHVRKELIEVQDALSSGKPVLPEWIDVAILALDGAWRSGATPEQIVTALVGKQTTNEGRTWPDWRTADPSKAIEHVRTVQGVPELAARDTVGQETDPEELANQATRRLVANFLRQLAGTDWSQKELSELAHDVETGARKVRFDPDHCMKG